VTVRRYGIATFLHVDSVAVDYAGLWDAHPETTPCDYCTLGLLRQCDATQCDPRASQRNYGVNASVAFVTETNLALLAMGEPPIIPEKDDALPTHSRDQDHQAQRQGSGGQADDPQDNTGQARPGPDEPAAAK